MNLDQTTVETLMQIATVFRERANQKYFIGNRERERLMQSACEEEKKYMILDMDEEQREIIDRMLECREDVADYDLTLAYLSGAIDTVVFLQRTGFLDMIFPQDVSEI